MSNLIKQEHVIAFETAINRVQVVCHGAGLALPFIYWENGIFSDYA